MSTKNTARQRFAALIRRADDQINLAEAALWVACEDRGTGDPEAAIRELDSLAARVRPHLFDGNHAPGAISAINQVLFDELGFRGNTWAYGDPRNSYLDDVLALRTGIPIALSIVYLEIGWRLGLPLQGVALPGHFIVRYNAPDGPIFVDPFNRGRRWNDEECLAQARLFYGSVTPEMLQRMLEPPSRRDILTRLLRNLKNSYVERNDDQLALAAVERIMLLDDDPVEHRDRGLLYARMGQIGAAISDLDDYARLDPQATDLHTVRRQAGARAERLGRRN